MTPGSSSAMKIGTKNEPNIAAHVGEFLKEHSLFELEAIKSYGLLCLRQMPFAAFSPDDVASVIHPVRGHFFAVLEYKTRVTKKTKESEIALTRRYGTYSMVELTAAGYGATLKQLIPEESHRSQILHNIVCAGVQDGFLIYASQTRILRVVHVVVGDEAAATYRSALTVICEAYMTWIYNNAIAVPSVLAQELDYCIDFETLSQNLDLWRALVKIIDERGRPLPPEKDIIPSLVAFWNRVKGGIDVFSRHLKNVKSHHVALPPAATIWLRIFMMLIYNAYQSFKLFQAYEYLMDEVNCDSYTSYQKYKQKLLSFRSFCREAAVWLHDRPRQRELVVPVTAAVGTRTPEPLNSATAAGFSYKSENISIWTRSGSAWLSKRLKHNLIMLEGDTQLCCVVCCQLNHDVENAGHHRQGYKTRYQCSDCKVALCRKPRWKGEVSCYTKFHEAQALPMPCEEPEQLLPKGDTQRRDPPSWKRQRSSEIPNRRSSSTRLQSRELR